MIYSKICSSLDPNGQQRIFFKKIYNSIKELALIGSLNGSVSGAIAAILAAYGYIALPGFGPIIAMGVSITFFISVIIGATIGSVLGILIGTLCVFTGNLYA